MSTEKKKGGKDFLDHLRKPTAPAPAPEHKPLAEKDALPAPPPAPRQEFVGFSARISVQNDLMLARVKHWVPGAVKQEIFNNALREYLLKFPESQKPLPIE